MGTYEQVPLCDRRRVEEPRQLANENYGPISQAEFQVLAHSACGGDLPIPAASNPHPTIEPIFIGWLATDPEAIPLISPRGIRIWSATLASRLDLQGCVIPHLLSFIGCDIQQGLWLPSADVRALILGGGATCGGINADGIRIHGPLFVRNHTAHGRVSFIGSVIEGNADFSGSKMQAEPIAMTLEGATVQGSMFCRDSNSTQFESSGEIRLLNARIRGDVGFTGARLKAEGRALSMDKVIVEGNVHLSDGFVSAGSVNIPGALIGGDLDCSNARIEANGVAMNLGTTTFRKNVFLRDGFIASGQVWMHSVEIEKSLDFGGATLRDAKIAIVLEKGVVQGGIHLCENFSADGLVNLNNARICGDLNCANAKMSTLYCLNMQLNGDLIWTGIRDPQKTSLCLNGAQIVSLRDERESWPGKDNLKVDGLRYTELRLHDPQPRQEAAVRIMGKEHELRARDRIEWLRLQQSTDLYEPQPWMQLANLFKEKGQKAESKRVVFELRRVQAKRSLLIIRGLKLFHALLEMQPLWVLATIAVLTAVGTFEFWLADRAHTMAPRESAAYSEWHRGAVIDVNCRRSIQSSIHLRMGCHW